MSDKTEGVRTALSNAQREVVKVQTALTDANPLAAQIPMYERLGKIVSELRNMLVEVSRLPL